MSKITYFAKDGSFGSAKGLECIDTTHWTEKDWERVEYASDNKRIQVAKRIARKYGPKTHEIKNWTKLDWEEYEWELAQMKKEQGKKKKKKKK